MDKFEEVHLADGVGGVYKLLVAVDALETFRGEYSFQNQRQSIEIVCFFIVSLLNLVGCVINCELNYSVCRSICGRSEIPCGSESCSNLVDCRHNYDKIYVYLIKDGNNKRKFVRLYCFMSIMCFFFVLNIVILYFISFITQNLT